MAPTEILARQHLHKFRGYLEATFPGLTVELLVSGLPAAERRRVRTAAASGHCALLVGTHALIEEDVEVLNLGLAVVDEQHRFGTRQRELLRDKGQGSPHFLAMTATPIPRTLALAVFGEMSVSVLDELPPGRTPVRTEVVDEAGRERAYRLVRDEVAKGRQAFVICPLVEESETTAAKAAVVEFERLRKDVFPDLRLALVHGRLKQKDEVMRAFAGGEADILVATSVVEVGVDVPNATVMLIEGAERFGLAQLHQFRGRVGRGAAESHCVLVADGDGPTPRRLQLVAETHDGFRLAQADLELRGMGELMGQRQHGDLDDLGMRALQQPGLLDEAREEAELVLAADPNLEHHPALGRAVRRRLEQTVIS
jgi:ATP-dependent DNA helicase RecG